MTDDGLRVAPSVGSPGNCPVADGRLGLTLHVPPFSTTCAARTTTSPSSRSSGRHRDARIPTPSWSTDRQVEVLTVAHEMGYFDSPRQSNATEVAESLGIGPSTLAEHLAAESKLVGQTID